jgi:hypothetical protein
VLVVEPGQVDAQPTALVDADDVLDLVVVGAGIAERGEPHRLALVVVRLEAAELGGGLVERPEGMREEGLPERLDVVALSVAEE